MPSSSPVATYVRPLYMSHRLSIKLVLHIMTQPASEHPTACTGRDGSDANGQRRKAPPGRRRPRHPAAKLSSSCTPRIVVDSTPVCVIRRHVKRASTRRPASSRNSSNQQRSPRQLPRQRVGVDRHALDADLRKRRVARVARRLRSVASATGRPEARARLSSTRLFHLVEHLEAVDDAPEHRVLACATLRAQALAARAAAHMHAPFRCECLAYVMKNWLPFVLGPLFAIDTTPRAECCARGAARQRRRPPPARACPAAAP